MAKQINLAANEEPNLPENTMTAEEAMRAQHQPTSNRPSAEVDLENYVRRAQEAGKKDGLGKKQFVIFARDMVEGGTKKVLSAGGKGAPDSDHGRKMYNAFVGASEQESGRVTTEKAAKSVDVQISKVRAFIRLGVRMPEEALNIFDRALKVHKDLVIKNADLKYSSTYTSLYNVAVQQVKNKDASNPKLLVPLTDSAIRTLMLNKTKVQHENTGYDYLVTAIKYIDAAIKGREGTESGRAGRDPITDPDVKTMRDGLYTVVQRLSPEAIEAYENAIAEALEKKRLAAEKKEADRLAKEKIKADREADKAKAAMEAEAGGVTIEDDEGEEPTDEDTMMEGEVESD